MKQQSYIWRREKCIITAVTAAMHFKNTRVAVTLEIGFPRVKNVLPVWQKFSGNKKKHVQMLLNRTI